jgi:hypothetical protein
MLTREAIRSFEERLANDKYNPKKLFAYVNSKRPKTGRINSMSTPSGALATNKEQIATLLNKQFQSVFSPEEIGESLPPFESKTEASITHVSFNQQKVLNHLIQLNPNKSLGNDSISPLVLKNCAKSMSLPLSIIFQQSFDQGQVPLAWQDANVTPLYKKKGSRSDPSSYRPISLTSVRCKIIEKIIRDEIMNHLIVNKLLKSCQHGFVQKKACVTNLLETMDFLTLKKKSKIPIDILFLDFAKAFDKVSHKLLLFKLEHYGIKGQLLSWIGAFLASRRQRVILGDSSSTWVPVTSDVPQGSVLGPTLFMVFVNDLPDHITSTCKMYADDTKILASAKTEANRSKMQDDLDSVTAWTRTWKMELDAKKCKVMHVGVKSAPL